MATKTPKSGSSRTKTSTGAYSKKKQTFSKNDAQWVSLYDEIYKLNGALMNARNIAYKIANNQKAFPKTRDNAKYLLKLLNGVRQQFWGPLTWYK